MENQLNSPNNQNENPRTNPSISSVDGFARPSHQGAGPSDNSSLAANPSDSGSEPSFTDHMPDPKPQSGNSGHVTPITTGGNGKSKVWTVVLVILIFIVFIGGIGAVYEYQQKKINKDEAQISSLTTQNASLTEQNTKLKSSSTVSVNSTTSTTIPPFKVTQFNIEFTVPATLADLTYTMNSAGTAANLSTETLSTLDPACTATATEAPLGSITKVNGQYPTTPSTTTTLIKQYSTYYIAYIKPVGNCSKVTQVNTLATSLTNDLNTSFKTIAATTSN